LAGTDRLDPDGDPANDNWSCTGCGTKPGILSDGSNGTYISATTSGTDENIGMDNHAVPGGATIDSVNFVITVNGGVFDGVTLFVWRDDHAGYCAYGNKSLGSPGFTNVRWKTTNGPVSGGSACNEVWSITKLNAGVEVEYIKTGSGTVQISEGWVDIYYTESGGAKKYRRGKLLKVSDDNRDGFGYEQFADAGHFKSADPTDAFAEPKWLWSN